MSNFAGIRNTGSIFVFTFVSRCTPTYYRLTEEVIAVLIGLHVGIFQPLFNRYVIGWSDAVICFFAWAVSALGLTAKWGACWFGVIETSADIGGFDSCRNGTCAIHLSIV